MSKHPLFFSKSFTFKKEKRSKLRFYQKGRAQSFLIKKNRAENKKAKDKCSIFRTSFVIKRQNRTSFPSRVPLMS
jgi:hypothetical protein